MQRIRKQSNYVKNKPSDLPVYLDDEDPVAEEEVDVTTVEPIRHEELKPMNIAMDDMEYADDFEFQDFDNAQDYQEFTRFRRHREALQEEFQYQEIPFYDGIDNPVEVDPEEVYSEDVEPEEVEPVEKKKSKRPPVAARPEDEEGLDPAEKEKRKKERLAAKARARYQSMTEEQRKEHNYRRRVRQLGINPDMATAEDVVRAKERMSDFYAKKAEVQRQKYHQLSDEQKKEHNRKRSENSRRRRQQEDEILYSNKPGEATAEQMEMAQQILAKSAKKAEAARLRYQRMTHEERKELNRRKAAATTRRRRLGVMDESSVQAYPQGPSGFDTRSPARELASDNQQTFENNGQGTSQDAGDDYDEADE